MKTYNKEIQGKMVEVSIRHGLYEGEFHKFKSLYTSVTVDGQVVKETVSKLGKEYNSYYMECINDYRKQVMGE